MQYLKKTIFLSNKLDDKIKSMATVTIEKKNNSYFGTIKSYKDIINGDLVLGIKVGQKIIKQNT